MKIENGGSTTGIYADQNIKKIDIICETPKEVIIYINDKSKTYLTVEQAVTLRDELNDAILASLSIPKK